MLSTNVTLFQIHATWCKRSSTYLLHKTDPYHQAYVLLFIFFRNIIKHGNICFSDKLMIDMCGLDFRIFMTSFYCFVIMCFER